jgi:hypothetical protein
MSLKISDDTFSCVKKKLKKRNSMVINIYISGGPKRQKLVWKGVTYSKESLRTKLITLYKQKKIPRIDVFYSGKRPIHKEQHLHYMIAPDEGLSASSKRIQSQHPESTLLTWDEFASEHLKKAGGKTAKAKAVVISKKTKTKSRKEEDEDIAPMPVLTRSRTKRSLELFGVPRW